MGRRAVATIINGLIACYATAAPARWKALLLL